MKVKLSRCPHCDSELTGATDPLDEDLKPKVGDVTVCIFCAGISLFDTDMTLRKPSAIEAQELLSSVGLSQYKNAVEMYLDGVDIEAIQ